MNKKKEKQKNTFEKIYEVIKTMASKPSGLIGLTILIFHVILAITSPLCMYHMIIKLLIQH